MIFNRLSLFLQFLRLIKSSAEQNLIRHACQLTSKAFVQTIKSCSKNISNEYMIKARFQYECQILDDTPLAFNPGCCSKWKGKLLKNRMFARFDKETNERSFCNGERIFLSRTIISCLIV